MSENEVDRMIREEGETEKRRKGNGNGHDKVNIFDVMARMMSAAQLETTVFPPLRFVIPDVVPEGVTLLVSRPKLGKSWMVLDAAVAVSAHRFIFGDKRPDPGSVLYLGLEDGLPRLQRRLARLLRGHAGRWPPKLSFLTECPRASQGGLEAIGAWCAGTGDARLVVVDTLARFRDFRASDSYATDYDCLTGLQQIASTYRIGVLVAHHDRKSGADDVFDTVSGTLGLNGAADTLLILKRDDGGAVLNIRGRDIDDDNLLLGFDKSSCRWSIRGNAADLRKAVQIDQIRTLLAESASINQIIGETGIARRTVYRLKREIEQQNKRSDDTD